MAEQPGHVTGIGGVFVKSKDPEALVKWYREVLGLDVKPWGGAAMPFDAPGHPPKIAWTAFPDSSNHMSPSTREFMINFAVDDMDAILARLTAHGVPIIKRDRNVRPAITKSSAIEHHASVGDPEQPSLCTIFLRFS